MNLVRFAISLLTITIIGGCAVRTEEPAEVPAAEDDVLGELASVTSGAWTGTAVTPFTPGLGLNRPWGDLSASASFAGPAGSTRRMGVCLLQMTTTPCTSVANCTMTPPPGGFVYCTKPDGAAQKYCAFRPGAPSTWCAGTPALGGNPPIASGSYTTPRRGALSGVDYVSYACFEGCSASDPSVSSRKRADCRVPDAQGNNTAFLYCLDLGCDGTINWCMGPEGGYIPPMKD
jgi:hypothetical protein